MEESVNKKKILYIDMDRVLVDFESGFSFYDQATLDRYKGRRGDIAGIFSHMVPMEGAVEAFHRLARKYDTYILSTAPWDNPSAWSDKLLWVQEYLGEDADRRLILSNHKDLNRGDYLIDDKLVNGAGGFQGELIQFGTGCFPSWKEVLEYLL